MNDDPELADIAAVTTAKPNSVSLLSPSCANPSVSGKSSPTKDCGECCSQFPTLSEAYAQEGHFPAQLDTARDPSESPPSNRIVGSRETAVLSSRARLEGPQAGTNEIDPDGTAVTPRDTNRPYSRFQCPRTFLSDLPRCQLLIRVWEFFLGRVLR